MVCCFIPDVLWVVLPTNLYLSSLKADLKPPHLGSAYLEQLEAKLDFHLNSGFLPSLRGAFP